MTGEKGRGPHGEEFVFDELRDARTGRAIASVQEWDRFCAVEPPLSCRPSTDEMRLTAAWVKRRRQAERQRRSMNPNVRTAGPRGGNEKPGKET